MKITLIRPQLGRKGHRRYDSRARMEPTALAVLAGLTPAGDEITVIDDRFETVPYDEPTDLVGLSLCTFSAWRGYEIASEYRARGVPVVVGGFHPTLVPHEAQRFADAVVLGEAEATWPQVVEDARRRRLQPLYVGSPSPSLTGAMPDWSVLRAKKYAPVSSIQFGRGCPHTCDFCSVRAFYQGRLNHRPLADVVADIENAGRKRVFFVDDNLIGNRRLAKQLFQAIEPLHLKWTTQVDINCVHDPDLLEAMVRSGCQCLIIGLESLQEKNLAQMHKRWATAADYARRLSLIRKQGILLYCTFVFGYDYDTPDTIKRTLEFAQENKFFICNFNPLQPFPGTPLHSRLLREGRLLKSRWWLDPSYRWGDVVFRPRSMTPDELALGCYEARMAFNKTTNILRRFTDREANSASLSNALLFAAGSIASRSELLSKVGLRLGETNSSNVSQKSTEQALGSDFSDSEDLLNIFPGSGREDYVHQT